MRKFRGIFFYAAALLVFGVVAVIIIHLGREEEATKIVQGAEQVPQSPWNHFRETYLANLHHPLAILLLQIITIIMVARIFAALFVKLGQPAVTGEIAAGLFLGPSFVGNFVPEFSQFLFPVASLVNLQFLSQIGLILFMFVVGMELDTKILKKKAHDAVVISHASILFPFALGLILAYGLYTDFSPANISFLSFALFTGIAMSVTAFPVLARIVQEKGLTKTRIGALAITCAAADDITAWCLLAGVIAVVKAGSLVSALYTIVFAAAYVYVMLKLVKPFLKRIGDKYSNREGLSKPVVAIFFITLLVSSYLTELIGIHALFGAFMAGVVMPSNARFRSIFIDKVEDVALVLLLPLFFVFTGLRTEIGLLNDSGLWWICLLVIVVAVSGKFFGSALAARFTGNNWHDSLVIGALMNTRGLMELVVLNIGYDLGVFGPEIFAMMVIMALVTTLMTSPALSLINKVFTGRAAMPAPLPAARQFNVLVAFGRPEKSNSLLRIANALVRKETDRASVTAMHLSPSTDINQYNFHEYEKESFRPVRSEAKKLNLEVNLFFKPSRDIETEIGQTASEGNFNLLLVGCGKSVFEDTALGRFIGFGGRLFSPRRISDAFRGHHSLFKRDTFDPRVHAILRNTRIPAGVIIDRKPDKIERVLAFVLDPNDTGVIELAQRLTDNGAAVTIGYEIQSVHSGTPAGRALEIIKDRNLPLVEFLPGKNTEKQFLSGFDLMLMSYSDWRRQISTGARWMANAPSIMIVRK